MTTNSLRITCLRLAVEVFDCVGADRPLTRVSLAALSIRTYGHRLAALLVCGITGRSERDDTARSGAGGRADPRQQLGCGQLVESLFESVASSRRRV